MGATSDRYRRLHSRETGAALERVVFFSDAVFAIALTLLVIDIRIPEGLDVTEGIAEVIPQVIAYAISFYVIAANWVAHHRKFSAITAVDGGLIWLNLMLLFLIALVPFPTSLLSREGSTPLTAVVLYASTVAAIGVVQWVLWVYARRHDLIDTATIDDGIYRLVRLNLLTTPAVFLLSIPIAVLTAPSWGMYTWLLLIPASMLSGRWEPRARRPGSTPEAADAGPGETTGSQ